MNIAILAGIGMNNELGKENALLWHLPLDMKHFRDLTRDHAVIMGRKTFDSIGKPLPSRQNIVITRDTAYTAEGVTLAHSFDEALEKVDRDKYPGTVFNIGGAQIYTEGMNYADTLYVTHVHKEFSDADTFFPKIDQTIWEKIAEEKHIKDEQHVYDYDFVIYKKRA